MQNLTETSIIEVFNFDKSSVRTVAIDNDFWFVAADIAEVLGYRDSYDMVRLLDDDEKTTHTIDVEWLNQHGPAGVQSQEMTIINESGLYNAIFRSQKDAAKAFRKWVTGEVLPSLRKHGVYRLETELKQLTDAHTAQLEAAKARRKQDLEDYARKTKNIYAENRRLNEALFGYKDDELWLSYHIECDRLKDQIRDLRSDLAAAYKELDKFREARPTKARQTIKELRECLSSTRLCLDIHERQHAQAAALLHLHKSALYEVSRIASRNGDSYDRGKQVECIDAWLQTEAGRVFSVRKGAEMPEPSKVPKVA